MRKKICTIFLLIFIIFTNCSCSTDSGFAEKQSYQMGTIISQKIYGNNAEKVSNQIYNRFQQIEDNMSINMPTSLVSELNNNSGTKMKMNDDTLFVLETSKKYSELTNGAFDVTIGPLVKEWGIFSEHPHVPTRERISELIKLVGYKSISIDKENKTATLLKHGQIIDLGGIAKGFAADEAIKICKQNGIVSAYVNLGGNVSVLGNKPDGSPWKIGIQNPRAADGKYIGILNVADKTIVTSGDYERFFEKNGIRYHHIIDPATGYPSKSDLISSTIVTEKSIIADALSTATFVLGLEKSQKLISKLTGVDAIFITKNKEIYVSDGLKKYFTLKDESGEFKYAEKR